MSQDILVNLIDPDPEQPRRHFDMAAIDELAQSIASDGLASPILVRPVGERFVIVYGELEARFVVTQGAGETTWDWPAAFALLRDIRPEDNPVCWFAKANGPDTAAIIEGCAELGRCIDAAGGVLPQWGVAAFWWASLAVYLEASVADLARWLRLWEARFVSALTHCLMFPERPEASKGELEMMLYYGYQSDVRHSSALAWADRDAERPERIQEGIWRMLDDEHWEHMPLPSACQPWGFQHERYMELTEGRRAW